MSRTYRRNKPRKGLHRLSYQMTSDDPTDWWTGYQMKRYGVQSVDKLRAAIRAEFHGDTHSGRWNAPHWYRRMHHRPVKLENNALLRRAVRKDEFDDLSLTPFRHNACYYWW